MAALEDLYAVGELLLLYIVAWIFGEIGSRLLPAIQKCNERRKRAKSTSHKNIAMGNNQKSSYIKLPPLLGMLIAGVLLRNINNNLLLQHIPSLWSASIRKAALTVILVRAGLGLNIKQLKKKSFTTLRLSFIPCLIEVITITLFTYFVFKPYNINFILSMVMGFVLGAVSPAVVVPSLLDLQDQGFGINKGIPSMILAAASLDDIFAICGFGITLSIAFSSENLVRNIIDGPVEVVGGIIIGLSFGWILSQILNLHQNEIIEKKQIARRSNTLNTLLSKKITRSSQKNSISTNYLSVSKLTVQHQQEIKQREKVERNQTYVQFVVLLAIALLIVFIASDYGYAGGGYLATMIAACFCGQKWNKPFMVKLVFKKLWYFMQVALFMLIGSEIDLSVVSGDDIIIVISILCISLFIRLLITFLVVFGSEASLNIKEKLFVAIAWFPKATVQAAVGSTVLDTANSIDKYKNDQYYINIGQFILISAVLSIIISAPIGAIGIYIFGPKWLKKGNKLTNTMESTTEEEKDDIDDTNDSNYL